MWLFALAGLVIAGVGCLFVRRASSEEVAREQERLPTRDPRLFSISAPPGLACCTAVLGLRSHRFGSAEVPHLPLAGCTMARDCRCRYQAMAERRIEARRSGEDRRALIRYDPANPPRRRGPGRRQEDWLCWPGVELAVEKPSEAKRTAEDPTPPAEGGVTAEATTDHDGEDVA